MASLVNCSITVSFCEGQHVTLELDNASLNWTNGLREVNSGEDLVREFEETGDVEILIKAKRVPPPK